jgi:capsular polysaccharide biosynthesis protein
MSQQALDLRRSTQIVRRHKILVAIVMVLGIAGGAAYAVLKPPMLASTALIALPASVSQQQSSTTTGGSDPFTATQEVVAGSTQVLLNALSEIHPALSLDQLRGNVQVSSPSADIISVTAKGKNAAAAEATANAVANSYISYVSSAQSAVGRIQARSLQVARNATGPSPVERMIVYALLGGLAGAVIGMIVALVIGRNDRRLRERDAIASSVGIPVLASVPVARPSSASGWTKLFEGYKPNAVHSWQLRTALQQLMGDHGFGRNGYNGNGSGLAMGDKSFSLLVLSLSSDPGALALGPQLAVFAATQGIRTALVVGPQQDTSATATLRTACETQMPAASTHNGLFRAIASDAADIGLEPDTRLVIVVAVVDSRSPKMPDTTRADATVIGVCAGTATAEQLARAAVVAATDGREITGFLVGDPDPDDQTTGRIPHLVRPAQRRPPNRLRGIVTEIRR